MTTTRQTPHLLPAAAVGQVVPLPQYGASFPGEGGPGGPRSIGSVTMLRVSVTDRCNFRCTYCMPAEGLAWLPKKELLTPAQIERVVAVASGLHRVRHVKLTGGEPTLRPDLPEIVTRLRGLPGVTDLSMTTNGFRLVEQARMLREVGLDRMTVSLDSLHPDRFAAITRTGRLDVVLAGIEAALTAGMSSVKLNCVVVAGVNDDEVAEFARLTLRMPVTVRFIEYMPMGHSVVGDAVARTGGFVSETDVAGTVSYRIADDEQGPTGGCGAQDRGASRSAFVAEPVVRARIEAELGRLAPVERDREPGVGPAVPWRLDRADAIGRIGFISAMSRPFCSTCNRLRLTATGVLRSCLFEGGEVDLAALLRGGESDEALAEAMTRCVALKPEVHSAHGGIQMSRVGG